MWNEIEGKRGENGVIQLRSNPGPTGRMINKMLAQRGLLIGEVRGVVNYGYGGPTPLPCLNKRAGTFNKFQELELLRTKGVATVPFSMNPWDLAAPLLGRDFHHTRGTDIGVYRIHPLARYGVSPDYYTQLIPKQREFRVWSYRRKAIGTYEKVLSYPNRLGRRGRSRDVWNYRNGYAYLFRHPEGVDPALKQLGANAIDAVGLDFGAADVIQGRDGKYYVLEVNSAPGVEGERQCVTSLVGHIERWARGGFKRRNGEEE